MEKMSNKTDRRKKQRRVIASRIVLERRRRIGRRVDVRRFEKDRRE